MVHLHTNMASIAALSLALFTSHTLAAGAMTYVGCFSSSDGLSESGTYQYQSSGYCQGKCLDSDNQAVLGLTGGDDCWCGSQLPPNSDKVDDSKCSTGCTGYGKENCGGTNFWSVYLTGAESNVDSVDGSSTSAAPGGLKQPTSSGGNNNSPSTTSAKPSVVTSISPGKTVVVTESPTIDPSQKGSSSDGSSGGGSSHTGVIVGVIVGVVVLILLGVAAWFFLVKRRKQHDAEASGAAAYSPSAMSENKEWKIPSTSRHTQYARPNGGDARLDDGVAGNRASSYSLDDSNDYTRKILTVANPDH